MLKRGEFIEEYALPFIGLMIKGVVLAFSVAFILGMFCMPFAAIKYLFF